jgi:hypothetical protein
MNTCPKCDGKKGYPIVWHDQTCTFDAVCERHEPEWVMCSTCRGDGLVSDLGLAIYEARGGPGPILAPQ